MLELDNLCKHFGGVKAVDGVSLEVAQGRDLRPDRPQRLRQEHHRQPDRRLLPADLRPRRRRWAGRDGAAEPRAGLARRRAHVPEHPPLRPARRVAEPVGGGEPRPPEKVAAGGAALAQRLRGRSRAHRQAARVLRPRPQARRSRRQPVVRRAAPAGACACARRRAEAAAARRAGGRHERGGDRGARPAHPGHPRHGA